jgi:hypothetical protein
MTRKQWLFVLGLLLGNLAICALLVFLIQSNRPLSTAEVAATLAALAGRIGARRAQRSPGDLPAQPRPSSAKVCRCQGGCVDGL